MKKYSLSIQTQSLEGEYTRPKPDPSKNQFAQYIGYRMVHDTKIRRRRSFNFGANETTAIALSVQRQQQYAAIVSNWDEISSRLTPVLKEYDWRKPVWIEPWMEAAISQAAEKKKTETAKFEQDHKKAAEAYDEALTWGADQHVDIANRYDPAAIQRYLASQGMVAVSFNSVAGRQAGPKVTTTIREAYALYIAEEQVRIGKHNGKGLKTGSYNIKEKNLWLALGQSTATVGKPRTNRNFLNVDEPLSVLSEKEKLKEIADYWGDPKNIGSERTGKNYVDALKAFLLWCVGQEQLRFEVPKGFDKIMEFKVCKSKKAIDYDPKMIRGILDNSTEMTRMYELLAMNCGGMYQKDIADLEPTDRIIHDGIPCLWWFRSKEAGVQGADTTFRILSPLWPETDTLIQKLKAKPNPFNRMFLNEQGTPLVKTKVSKQTSNNVAEAYYRAWDKYVSTLEEMPQKKLKFKQFRKLVWNMLKREFSVPTAKLYSGQRISGVDFDYDDARPEDYNELIPVMAKVREKLIADGVLDAIAADSK